MPARMAHVVIFTDDHSLFLTEIPGEAQSLVAAINNGNYTLPVKPERRAAGLRPVATRHGELVMVTWLSGAGPAQPMDTGQPVRLTRREHEVLQHLADGLTTKQIGLRMGLTPRTIRTYSHSINTKLGAQTSEESVARGVLLGLCRPLEVRGNLNRQN